MNQRHSSVSILGGGPAALLSQIFLSRNGVSSCIFAESLLGNLAPLQIGEARVAPIPIFITPGTFLAGQLALGPLLETDQIDTRYTTVVRSHADDRPRPGSYADFMTQQYADAERRLIITKKHTGQLAFERDLPGLRRKVLSHYPVGHAPTRRVGFTDGVSPFLSFVERQQRITAIDDAVVAVDVAKRCFFTRSQRVTYDHLVSTLPLLNFLTLAGMQTSLTTVSGGAQLVVASTRNLARRNQLIYDCDSNSPIHRVFIPRDHFVIAQVSRAHWDSADLTITARIQELCQFDDLPVTIRRMTVHDCYPLGLSDYSLRDEIIGDLRRSGVTLFGRLAQWEYLDLEELEWERITSLA